MIIIAPFAKALKSGPNPKDYPRWEELIRLLGDHHVVQVGSSSERQLVDDHRTDLSLEELTDLVHECRIWIGVDSFFQHFCWDLGKPGIVLWGPSDPVIFGHPENINLLKSRDVLTPDQFLTWDLIPVRDDIFVEPSIVVDVINSKIE